VTILESYLASPAGTALGEVSVQVPRVPHLIVLVPLAKRTRR
jgi:cation transporter-like permease